MPDWAPFLHRRLAGLSLGPGREAEIVEELSQHLDQRYEELRAGGAADQEAHRIAIEELREPDVLAQQLGSLRQAHLPPPATPGTGGLGPGSLWQDLAFAGRLLRKQPGFAAAVVLTLALGIGANTAIFSLVNATLLRRLPVADPDRLSYVYRGGTGGVFAYPMYAHLRDGNDALDGFAAWGGITVSLHAGDAAELVQGAIVSGNLFEVLGVRAAQGRLIGVQDDLVRGAHPVAVISHDYWRSRFEGRPDALGREVRLNGHAFTIVGVAPEEFPGPQLGGAYNLYVPMMMQAVVRPPRARYSGEQNPDLLGHPTSSWLFGVARLKPGVSAEQARAQLDTLAAGYFRTLPQAAPPPRITLVPLDEGDPNRRRQMQSVALLLGGVAAAVLLIACANIANLLLSRIASRGREFAVRLALGASRARLVQQLLVESLLLSLLGGAVGVGLAWAVVEAFQAAPLPAALPPIDLSIDRRVLLFSFALSCLTGVVFGAAPALRASRPNLVPALKDARVEGDGRRRRLDLKKTLVVAEVALSLLLLIAAGLFVRSLLSARAIDPGFDAARLVHAPLEVNLLRYTRDQGREFYRQVIGRVGRLPGVESASLARVPVLTGSSRVLSLHVEGREASHDRQRSEGASAATTADRTAVNANVVGLHYFRTLGVPLVLGRDFSDLDAEGRQLVAIVNETAAGLHFPGEPAVGRHISVDGPEGPWREIVGVAKDSRYAALAEGPLPVVYLPLGQNHESGMALYVRASVEPASLVGSIRREVRALEPDLPLPIVEPVTQTIATSLFPARMGAWLLGVFGILALTLAAVGIYGVLSFSISRRTQEMGIRLALGAESRSVFLLVVRDGMVLVGAGIVFGLAAGLAGGRLLAGFLYGVPTSDAATFAATTVILATVALAACVFPARRAMRVDPITALRYE